MKGLRIVKWEKGRNHQFGVRRFSCQHRHFPQRTQIFEDMEALG